MTRRDLAADMEKRFGRSILSIKQFREYSGYSNDLARAMTRGIRNFGTNRKGQRFHVLDLADCMYDK